NWNPPCEEDTAGSARGLSAPHHDRESADDAPRPQSAHPDHYQLADDPAGDHDRHGHLRTPPGRRGPLPARHIARRAIAKDCTGREKAVKKAKLLFDLRANALAFFARE